ncbi:BREX-2 system phosphatase PglZ [Gordonia phosphorivorans]|uniref:BREX-2 system phosphatase PglZ n=1 Tax=Gordonia phosphorivorans TaxID=1056982 RepID=A0ABV6HAZ7_9ACTN
MTVPSTLPRADLPGLLTLIGQVRAKDYRRGVLAVAAQPEWTGADTVDTEYGSLRVRTASSVLAIRDALTERDRFDWVVVLTDRSPAELPTGVVDHLTVGAVSNLDPWPALRSRFNATRQEFDLLSLQNAAARSALTYLPDAPAPAPGGVLTADHLFRVIAGHNFGLRHADITPHNVALWSTDPDLAARFTRWRTGVDATLLAEFDRWLQRKLGTLGPLFTTVLQTAGPHRLVPLGLAAGLFDDAAGAAAGFPAPAESIVRSRTLLEVLLGNQRFSAQQLAAWGHTASLVVPAAGPAVLTSAEDLVVQLQATELVGRSDMLPSALTARIARFARVLADSQLTDPHPAAAPPAAAGGSELTDVENCWADVVAHRLARPQRGDARRDVRVAAAALRLLRWLRRRPVAPTSTAEWLTSYRAELSWVDGAVDEVFVGATDPQLADAAHRIVSAARARRADQDRGFARFLAADGAVRRSVDDAPTYIEDLLDTVVRPLTALPRGESPRPSPVLLIVADGMSGAAANELVADMVRRTLPQWTVCLPRDTEPVTVALSALPSVTEFSRCSLLSGRLARGGQSDERAGFDAWLNSRGLRGVGRVLFHKADMEAAARANALASAVQEAVDDTAGRPVIACVLNDIDDALDRSDPIGTVWTTDRFKRLDSLLAAAAAVGRTVVLVSDHGHVVERREQPSAQRGTGISARYRQAGSAVSGGAVSDGAVSGSEVLVEGPRVLLDEHRVVLAVDEQLRYTGLKAGYHGGGALAEVSIPVTVLVNGSIGEQLPLIEASLAPGEPLGPPTWWEPGRATRATGAGDDTVAPAPAPAPKPRRTPAPTAPAAQPDTLFDLDDQTASTHPAPSTGPTSGGPSGGRDRVAELLATDLFARLFKQFGRNQRRDAIAALLRETIDSGGVLPLARAAQVLDVKAFRAGPAVQSLAQVLNTDGVIVLTVSGTELHLETETMFEQFGVQR